MNRNIAESPQKIIAKTIGKYKNILMFLVSKIWKKYSMNKRDTLSYTKYLSEYMDLSTINQ